MNFVIYNEDGPEPGRITQSNKVFSPEGYDKLLLDQGLKFITLDQPGYVNPDNFYVNVKDKVVIPRPIMPIQISRTTIRAGGQDAAVFQGVPLNALATVTTAGMQIGGASIPSGEFDLPIPVPCVYTISITKWPYKTFTVNIEAR